MALFVAHVIVNAPKTSSLLLMIRIFSNISYNTCIGLWFVWLKDYPNPVIHSPCL
jgi:hypothetical protein